MTVVGEQGEQTSGSTGGIEATGTLDLRCDQVDCRDRTFEPTAPEQSVPVLDVEPVEADRGGTWSSFVRVHNVACRRIEAALVRRHELTLASYDVLRVLAMEVDGRLRMTELAERVVLSRSGTSRVVDGLENQGLVRRKAVDDDLRGFFAVLTDRGQERFVAAEVTHGAAVDAHVLSCLDPHERRSLREVLGQIAGTLGSGADGRTAGSRTSRVGRDTIADEAGPRR